MIARSLIGFGLLAADVAGAFGSQVDACRTHPELVGACRTVRGRLAPANGIPSIRIWIVGTQRILGLSGGEDPVLPANLRAALGDRPFERQVYGDFRVCPLTRQSPGRMQMVCVASAHRLAVRRLR